ncbi:type II secretion system F family protein [Patescibacteria group bacterium]|nr:MAG: type II secretion system F family protein [Patescibacteria group bacterium]
MITYVYTAKNRQTGEVVKANVKAESTQAAAKLLAERGLFAVSIVPEDKSNILSRLGFGGRITLKDRVIFTRQLSTLINAGLPLTRALRSAEEQLSNKKFKSVIAEVIASVEGGSTLSDAFSKHPKVFNEIYIALVAAGETSGTLDKALLRLANQQEKDAAIISKIRSALVYPVIVLVVIGLVVGFMLVTVVPQVQKLYKDLHKDLPIYTQLLVWGKDFLLGYWWAALIALGILGYLGSKVLATERVRLELDRMRLKIPVFGVLFQKVYMARFSRTMNTLLASGIPMLQAMETTQRAVSNRVIASEIGESIKDVRGGKELSKALQRRPHFHPLVAQMAGVGEESGAIDDMLDRCARYFEDDVDEAVKNLSTTLEPVMMVVLGVIVALVLVAVLGPVYSLVGAGDIGSSTPAPGGN